MSLGRTAQEATRKAAIRSLHALGVQLDRGPTAFRLPLGESAARLVVRLESAGYHGATWLDAGAPASLVESQHDVAIVVTTPDEPDELAAVVAATEELGWVCVACVAVDQLEQARRSPWAGRGVRFGPRFAPADARSWALGRQSPAPGVVRVDRLGTGVSPDGAWRHWPLEVAAERPVLDALRARDAFALVRALGPRGLARLAAYRAAHA